MVVKSKCINISEELFNALGRVTFEKHVPANAVIIIAVEEYIKNNVPDVWKEYREAIRIKHEKAS